MQVLKLFAIRDIKTEVFDRPFPQKTHGEAERTFQQIVNDPQTYVSKHPDDFELYFLGTYDDHTGRIDSLEIPQRVTQATSLLNKEAPSLQAVQ